MLGDGRGNAIHLGERDCSLQRRHQKVWEEGPSPALNQTQRTRSARSAPPPCANCSYSGAGTIEFLYEDGEFYFIEMNTRIQVEHPVTEMITGDRSRRTSRSGSPPARRSPRAGGCRIPGHAIECRINAENPATFRPSPGTITYYHPPGGLGVRVDQRVYPGYTIPP